jgi:hypothetical protein
MTILINDKGSHFQMDVYNTGYRVAIHNSVSKKYLKSLIKKYSEWVKKPNAACYGHGVVVNWS